MKVIGYQVVVVGQDGGYLVVETLEDVGRDIGDALERFPNDQIDVLIVGDVGNGQVAYGPGWVINLAA
jgi:hypothetical protein